MYKYKYKKIVTKNIKETPKKKKKKKTQLLNPI